jgi:hypothetical protein
MYVTSSSQPDLLSPIMSIPKKVLEKFITTFNVRKAIAKLSPDRDGHRLYPTRTTKNDAASNFRCDQGTQYKDDPNTFSANIQANANASNTSVRKFAEQNPDKKLFSFPLKKDDTQEEVIQRMKDVAEKQGYL